MDNVVPKQPKPEKKKKRKVAIRAEKVEVKLPSGLYRVFFKNDIITDPWPELLQMAELDQEHRVFAIIE